MMISQTCFLSYGLSSFPSGTCSMTTMSLRDNDSRRACALPQCRSSVAAHLLLMSVSAAEMALCLRRGRCLTASCLLRAGSSDEGSVICVMCRFPSSSCGLVTVLWTWMNVTLAISKASAPDTRSPESEPEAGPVPTAIIEGGSNAVCFVGV